jgi:hypothetical protein
MSSSLSEIINNPHFLQIASLLNVAQSARWRRAHPEMPNVRETLDRLARFIRGGSASFNHSDTLKHDFASEFTALLAEIVMQDVKLQYSTQDAQWIFETLFSDGAAMVFSMLFAMSVSQQHWYSAEEVAAMTSNPTDTAGAWKNKAARGEIYAVERAGQRTWMFPALELRARGIPVPPPINIEVSEPEEEDHQ